MFRSSDLRRQRPGAIRGVLTAMGLASMVVSAINIVATRNYKRIIAFASINHAGAIAPARASAAAPSTAPSSTPSATP
ncbi:MAG: hypothetical protein IPJ59_34310 [Nannocystis sp.]|nr:hypothetical protein [Nannocystis sp.]